MRPAIRMPFQKALKLPATRPERIVNDAPPSREAVTISCTCLECELVKTLVNSGISTAASVPQLMIEASCHHKLESTCVDFGVIQPSGGVIAISLSRSQLMPYDVVMQSIEAIQISRVSGCSKSNSFFPLYCASDHAWLMKYEAPDIKS